MEKNSLYHQGLAPFALSRSKRERNFFSVSMRGLPFCLAALAWSALALCSCAPPAKPLPPSPPPASMTPPEFAPRAPVIEESLQSPLQPRVIIAETKQSESEDRQTLFFEGKLENQGPGATTQLKVTVEARDETGRVVTAAEALPLPQEIHPGDSASFIVRFPNDKTIRTFHVKAEIR